ncbi:MAG TPA: glycosyltransferase family 39 protein [Actinomycetes bacterium]|nr:glycosyltransferase family 39 protein [Actinomycetes bacterium]
MSATTRPRHTRSRPIPLRAVPQLAPIRRAALPPPKRHWLRQWLRDHWLSLLIVAGLLLAVGLVHAIGYDRYPARTTDDEGTYVSQAWAVLHWRTLAHYTYWYDHPPFGWITMASYMWVTDALRRLPTSVSAGREVMIWAKVISAAMMYLLARRLAFHRLAAAGAVLLFGLSPLGLEFQRMVFLDNLAVMWTLAALALAASPKRSLAASTGSAICFGFAVLTKETTAVLFPVLLLLLWQHSSPQTRRYRIPLFLTVLAGLTFTYPLYAMLKNELLEGPGHVSLIWAVKWQLFDRPPTGSVLDPTSDSYGILRSWLDLDPWLLLSGVVLTPVALLLRRVRAVAFGLGIQAVMMLRNGYLPYPYVIAMLPFAALVIAGVADQLGNGPRAAGQLSAVARRGGQLVVVALVAASVMVVGPQWRDGLHQAMTQDKSQPPKQAVAYVTAHIPRGSTLLVDDNIWTDLVRHGFDPNPVWFYKLDLDPVVRAKYKNGWRDIDYVVLRGLPPSTVRDLPLVAAAIKNSEVVASFGGGEITVRRVLKDAPDQD